MDNIEKILKETTEENQHKVDWTIGKSDHDHYNGQEISLFFCYQV